MTRRVATLAVLVAAVMATVGAGAVRADVDAAEVRRGLVLAEEPAGAVSLAAAKTKLTTKPQPVVIAGRIGAKGVDPFLKGKASFSLLEIPTDNHAAQPGHNPDECPFCKKRAANSPIAAVRFLGADGKEIPVDARELFGVKAGQDVVIRGTAVFDPKLAVQVLQVTADGIYVRKPKQ